MTRQVLGTRDIAAKNCFIIEIHLSRYNVGPEWRQSGCPFQEDKCVDNIA